jgi:tripartite-type tricarboxylate transporter receptor subunit TctC
MLRTSSGADLVHVPYKGGSAAISDLLSGVIDLGFLDLSISLPQIKAGKLKVLATTGERRTAVLPDVPTVAESGYPGYAIGVWFAMFAPTGTPKDIVERLNKETVEVLRDAALVAKMRDIGQELESSTPEQLGQFLKSETQRLSVVVKNANATVD